jgi:hypothetical protein
MARENVDFIKRQRVAKSASPSGNTVGQNTPSIPPRKNIPLSRISDLWHTRLTSALPKGRSRSSRDAGRVAVDAAASARMA